MPTSQADDIAETITKPRRALDCISSQFLPWVEMVCCAMLAALLLWKGFLPGWRFLNTDFPNYYLVARLLRQGYVLDRIYDWIWLQRIKDHWGLDQPLVGFAGLTPFSAVPILPFSFLPALLAKRFWLITNLFLLATTVELLVRVTRMGRRRVWLLALLAVFPLRTSFLLGQMHLLVLFLLALAYFLYRRERGISCAICLSIAGGLKVYPLLFIFYFCLKKQWRTAAAMGVSVLLLLAVGYAWISSDAMHIYLTQVLPRSLQGEVLDPYNLHAGSFAALFHRLFIFEPSLNPAPLVQSPTLYSILYPLCQMIIFLPLLTLVQGEDSHTESEPLEWAAYLYALLVMSPVPASYHFVVIILSMTLLIDYLWVRRQFKIAGVAVSLYAAISIIEFVPPGKRVTGGMTLAFSRLWIELLLLALFLLCLWRARRSRSTPPASRLRIAKLCMAALVVWIVGALGYRHHFADLEEDLISREPPAVPAFLSTGVRRTPEGYLATFMTANGYRVLDQDGQALWNNPRSGPPIEQLSFAIALGVPGTLIESAGRGGSSLIAIHAIDKSEAAITPIPLLADAESPAVSSGGTAAAFIREVKGHGRLWYVRLNRPFGHLRSEPIPLTNGDYDVRDVSFAKSGWLLFSARTNGRTSIFSLVPGEKPKVFLSGAEDVDSPAVSADERFVAFRKLVHDRWQLGYMNTATGHERMLTFGDCNAYSPSWVAPLTIAYATDCGRGLGLTALVSLRIDRDLLVAGRP